MIIKEELDALYRACFIQVAKEFKNKRYYVMDPIRNKSGHYACVITDFKTGFTAAFGIPVEKCVVLDKDSLRMMIQANLRKIEESAKKYPNQVKEMPEFTGDYKSGKRTAYLDHTETYDGGTIRFYKWTNLILK